MRVLRGEEIALGPGKVDLLALIGETGSIREAAERMGMSYMRAWKLIKTLRIYRMTATLFFLVKAAEASIQKEAV